MPDYRKIGFASLAMSAAAAGGLWWLGRRGHGIDLRDHVVLITGGSRGLGLHLARRFAACGARLALVAISAGELAHAENDLRQSGADVIVIEADISRRAEAERSVQEAVNRYWRLDVAESISKNCGSKHLWLEQPRSRAPQGRATTGADREKSERDRSGAFSRLSTNPHISSLFWFG